MSQLLPARAEVALAILERHTKESGGEFSLAAARVVLAHNGPFTVEEAKTWLDFLENHGFVYPVAGRFRVTPPSQSGSVDER